MTTIPTLAGLLMITEGITLQPTHVDLAADLWDALVGPTYSNKISARAATDGVLNTYPTSGIEDFAAYINFQLNFALRKQLQENGKVDHPVPMVQQDKFVIGNDHGETVQDFTVPGGVRAVSVLRMTDASFNWKVTLVGAEENTILQASHVEGDTDVADVGTIHIDAKLAQKCASSLLRAIAAVTPYCHTAGMKQMMDSLHKQLTANMYSSI